MRRNLHDVIHMGSVLGDAIVDDDPEPEAAVVSKVWREMLESLEYKR